MNGHEAIKKYKAGEVVALKRSAWGDCGWCVMDGFTLVSMDTNNNRSIGHADLAADDWEMALPPLERSNPSFQALVEKHGSK